MVTKNVFDERGAIHRNDPLGEITQLALTILQHLVRDCHFLFFYLFEQSEILVYLFSQFLSSKFVPVVVNFDPFDYALLSTVDGLGRFNLFD